MFWGYLLVVTLSDVADLPDICSSSLVQVHFGSSGRGLQQFRQVGRCGIR